MTEKGVFILVSNKHAQKRKGPHGKSVKDVIVAHDDVSVNTMFVTPLQLVHLLCGFNVKYSWKWCELPKKSKNMVFWVCLWCCVIIIIIEYINFASACSKKMKKMLLQWCCMILDQRMIILHVTGRKKMACYMLLLKA